jgi:hypothetical protein
VKFLQLSTDYFKVSGETVIDSGFEIFEEATGSGNFLSLQQARRKSDFLPTRSSNRAQYRTRLG